MRNNSAFSRHTTSKSFWADHWLEVDLLEFPVQPKSYTRQEADRLLSGADYFGSDEFESGRSGDRWHPDAVARREKTKKFREENPNLNTRLPRETYNSGMLVAPMPDMMTRFEKAVFILGKRVKETKLCYMLDGIPCNTVDIFQAAGMK